MRLVKARVQNYRSIIDTGEFDVEKLKSILVGPNEAGKTVLLQAPQQLSKPDDIGGFDPLRDYPRSKYNDITTGKAKPENITIVTGYFELEDEDKKLIPEEFHRSTSARPFQQSHSPSVRCRKERVYPLSASFCRKHQPQMMPDQIGVIFCTLSPLLR